MDCTATFHWLTRAVCATVADQCTLAYNGHVYDLSVLSRQQGSWNLTDAQRNTLVYLSTSSAEVLFDIIHILKYTVSKFSSCFIMTKNLLSNEKKPNVERIINYSLVHVELVNFVEFLINK